MLAGCPAAIGIGSFRFDHARRSHGDSDQPVCRARVPLPFMGKSHTGADIDDRIGRHYVRTGR